MNTNEGQSVEARANLRNLFHNMRLMTICGVLVAMVVGVAVLAAMAYSLSQKLDAAWESSEHPVVTNLVGPVSANLLTLQADGCVAKGPDGGPFRLGPVINGAIVIPKGSSFTAACFQSQPK